MRDRLIELIRFANNDVGTVKNMHKSSAEVIGDHLLENGVIVPPCKVGDTVYVLDEKLKVVEDEVYDVLVRFFGNIEVYAVNLIKHGHTTFSDFGKRVFFTREEAEAALKARENDGW